MDIVLLFSVLIVCIVGIITKKYKKESMFIFFCICICTFIDIKVIKLVDNLVVQGKPVHTYVQHDIKTHEDVNFEYVTKKITQDYERPYYLPFKRKVEFITSNFKGRSYK